MYISPTRTDEKYAKIPEETKERKFRINCRKCSEAGFKPAHYRSNAYVWDKRRNDYSEAQLIGIMSSNALFETTEDRRIITTPFFEAADMIREYALDLIDEASLNGICVELRSALIRRVADMKVIMAINMPAN